MKVLLATDGSIEADLAEGLIDKLAPHAEMTVTMVVNAPIVVPPLFLPPEEMVSVESLRLQQTVAERTVERVAVRLRESGHEASGRVLDGDAADRLLDVLEREEYDLVASGCGIESNFAALLLGSVSRKLVLYSKASVLVGKHYRNEGVAGSRARIAEKAKLDLLVAVDGSPGSNLAVDSLATAADESFGTIFVACVSPYGPAPLVPNPMGINFEDPGDCQRCNDIATGACDKLGRVARSVVPLVGVGRPSSVLVQHAEDHQVDLIMMGASRHGAMERFLVGSCAYETTTHAPCSVMILRNVLSLA